MMIIKKEEVYKYLILSLSFFCLSQQQQKLFLPLLKYYGHLWWILSISVEIAYFICLFWIEEVNDCFKYTLSTKQEFRSTISHCVCRCVLPLLTLTHTHKPYYKYFLWFVVRSRLLIAVLKIYSIFIVPKKTLNDDSVFLWGKEWELGKRGGENYCNTNIFLNIEKTEKKKRK